LNNGSFICIDSLFLFLTYGCYAGADEYKRE